MIFRDDDISCFTNLEDFKRVHDLFIKYETVHTIAVIAKDIEKHPELVNYIKIYQENGLIDVQLHCWDHVDLTKGNESAIMIDLENASFKLREVLGIMPEILFPPWNKHDDRLDRIADSLCLKVSSKKISLSQYIKAGGDVDCETINFHYWSPQEVMFLETALSINQQRKSRCI